MTEDTRSLESIVDALLLGRKRLRVLDAGCGSMSFYNHSKDTYLVGIDMSSEQLDKNAALEEKILGDVQTYPLPPAYFDAVICWDVLEHLPKPKLALKNFMKTVKEGGLILLVSPNVLTVRGLLTKFTPHWVHVWYYRSVIGFKQAGTPGNLPFKSYHRFAMSVPGIRRLARKNNFTVELCRYNTWDHPEHRYSWFREIWTPINKAVNVLSFGKIGGDEAQSFHIILKKQQIRRRL